MLTEVPFLFNLTFSLELLEKDILSEVNEHF